MLQHGANREGGGNRTYRSMAFSVCGCFPLGSIHSMAPTAGCRKRGVQDALLCLPLHDDRPVLMEIDQCTARLEDEQTRCSSRPAATSGICSTHLRERDRSVKEYKVASSRADALKWKAIVSKRQLVALKTPRDIQEAIKATEAYREVLQEETERRVTHAKRFYSDGA